MITSRWLKYALGWGIGLWLIGYSLGIVFFFVLPTAFIGWVITPIGAAITVLALFTIKAESVSFYLILGIAWTMTAVIFDYAFIVRAFNPSDGYYKPDVYLYYSLTFLLPIAIGWWRCRPKKSKTRAA